jgi:hypothetical protein
MPAERLSIAVSEDCAQTIRKLAEQHNTTVSAEIRAALKVYVSGASYEKLENAVAALNALEARLTAIEQRVKDKDEIIRAKDETIAGLKLVIALEPEEPRERATDTNSKSENFV